MVGTFVEIGSEIKHSKAAFGEIFEIIGMNYLIKIITN